MLHGELEKTPKAFWYFLRCLQPLCLMFSGNWILDSWMGKDRDNRITALAVPWGHRDTHTQRTTAGRGAPEGAVSEQQLSHLPPDPFHGGHVSGHLPKLWPLQLSCLSSPSPPMPLCDHRVDLAGSVASKPTSLPIPTSPSEMAQVV